MERKLDLKDVINIFLSYSIHSIKSESETPNINFKFKEEGYALFEKVINDKEYDLHKAHKEDIDFLVKHSDDDCLSIQINNSLKFFEYLTNIINETIELFNQYGDYVNPRETAIYLLRRIWLRMGISDIENVEIFLENQLQFVKNRIFDSQEPKKISSFQGCDVFMKTKVNELWDETTRSMVFTIKKDKETYELPHILYDINEVSKDSFATLSFRINTKSHFSINVTYQNKNAQKKTLSKEIYQTTNIFLNSEFLLYNEDNEQTIEPNTGGNLSIIIENKDNETINMIFKIIEKDTKSIIEKNALNFGFITSDTTYQYYYTEVLKGEEGELILHNKRLYGVLYGKIVNKNETNKARLNDTSFYPNEISNGKEQIYLNYNQHLLKLNFSYHDTSHCFNGCYLLITYEQKKFDNNLTTIEDDDTLIGYEFTILTRFWNYTDYISQIVDIPYNEYIIGTFEKGKISHHYYSINIPEGAKKLIIQVEGNYIDGFYGEGRIKINTFQSIGNTASLNIINPKNVLSLDILALNYTKKIISFAFRPKDNFADIYSFYYFRVLYIKENEQIYYPIDSYLGNLCEPEYNNVTNKYYCYLIYQNNYNQLSTKFAITSTTQNEYFLINATKFYSNNTKSEEIAKFIYLYTQKNEDIDYCIFTFEFPNGELKSIKSSFTDNVEDLYPQIYTTQMFFLSNMTKNNYFNLVNNYTLKHQYVYGDSGNVNVSFLNFEKFYSTRNFKGKPLAFPVGPETNKIFCSTKYMDYVYFLSLIYNMKNKGVEELIPGETISNFIKDGSFPLFYYLKVKNEKYINIEINLRLNSYDDTLLHNNFLIKGFVLDEDSINRKIRGEYIQLEDEKNGYYSDTFKVGLLQINQEIKDNKNYILIQILNNDRLYFNSYLLVEIVTKEINDNAYFLPINQYIIETFDDDYNETKTENKYYLCSRDKQYLNNKPDPALIEISSGFPDIVLEFNSSAHVYSEFDYYRGFNKYYAFNATDDDVYFRVINPKKRKGANYMMRYYFTGKNIGIDYVLDLNPEINRIKEDNDSVSICLTFQGFVLDYSDIDFLQTYPIYFYIYGFLFIKDENSDEQLNTTSILTEREYSFVNHTRHNYSYYNPEKWELIFENIPRDMNYVYELQLQVNSILENNIFNEEFLIFTTQINLTNIKPEEKKDYTLYIVLPIVAFVVLVIVGFFIFKYIRLQKSNRNLKEDLKSMAYSNDIQKNVIKKDQKNSQNESDYESTFI